ncbi:MAG: PilN domain-containing protein [Candidatus Rokubacteria bacterium]|nr:PilN domain-containing protein [Candidatus Rokubacteria bacterium]
MIKINLAPPTAKKRFSIGMPGFNLGILFGILFVVVVGAVGLWWWTLDSEVQGLNRQIAENQKEITRLKQVIAEGQRFKREKEELERRVNAIESVARLQTRPVYLLDAVADMLTKDLWLTRMEEKGQQLRFAGTTYSSTALADFMANLKASGKFKDVDLLESRQDLTKSPRTITFEVSCRFEI